MASTYATRLKNDRNRSLRERVAMVRLSDSGLMAVSCDEFYYSEDIHWMADRLKNLAERMDRADALAALGLDVSTVA